MANRVWSYFFGRGIIDPVDDIRASNPPSNPALLDALTKDFVDAQFRPAAPDADDRQLAHLPGEHRHQRVERERHDNFSHAMPRRLSAEQLMDARGARDRRPARFPGGAAGYAAPSS